MIEIAALHFFAAIVLHIEFDLPRIMKRILKISRSKETYIDCFPCFSFWASLIATCFTAQSIHDFMVPVYIFITAKFYEKLRS